MADTSPNTAKSSLTVSTLSPHALALATGSFDLSSHALHLTRLKSQDAAEIMCLYLELAALKSPGGTFISTSTQLHSPDSNSNSIGSQPHTVRVRGRVTSAS